MERRHEVLVGVDGSPVSTAAVVWAAHKARSRGCGLGIVHCADPSYYGLWTSTALIREGLRETCRPITEAAAAVARQAEPDVPLFTSVLIGSPARLLVLQSRRVELVVVGRSGHGALSRLLLGSVPQRLMANAHCPVVAVAGPPRNTAAAELTRMVAAVSDVTKEAETLAFALDTAQRRGVDVRVLHAIVPGQSPLEERLRLDELLGPWRARYPAVGVQAEARPGALRELIGAWCGPGDLLVLGHHRRSVFAPHSVGTRTRAALDAAPGPVAVVHELLAPAAEHIQPTAVRQLEGSPA